MNSRMEGVFMCGKHAEDYSHLVEAHMWGGIHMCEKCAGGYSCVGKLTWGGEGSIHV